MNTLGLLLRSTSRTEILRALMYQPDAVGLRQVARIAGVHPHAAELALATLVREDLVKRQGTSRRPLYALNRRHADIAVLAAVFSAAARGFIEARSRTLTARARSLLPFIRETTRMLTHARRSRHVA